MGKYGMNICPLMGEGYRSDQLLNLMRRLLICEVSRAKQSNKLMATESEQRLRFSSETKADSNSMMRLSEP